jgi:hypothetical protein
MVKKRFCIYHVEDTGTGREIGYVRIKIDDSDERLELRSSFVNGYTSYTYAVTDRMHYHYRIYDKCNWTLVNEYDEYYTL